MSFKKKQNKRPEFEKFVLSKTGLNSEYMCEVTGRRRAHFHYTPSDQISINEHILGVYDRDLDDNMNANREILNRQDLSFTDFCNIIDLTKP